MCLCTVYINTKDIKIRLGPRTEKETPRLPALISLRGVLREHEMNENRFYVYVHKIKETGEVFYVGKGTAYRLINKHKRSKKWYEITENNEWFAEKYYEDLDKNTALDIELLLINELKPVCNKHTKDIRNKKLNEEFLFARYEYSETSETGLIYKQWNMQNGSKRRDAGQSAGTTSCNGYFTVSNGRCSGQVMNHRVVWLLVNGEDPGDMIIDHIDGDRKNNKVSNLRKIHQEENSRNNSKRKDNKTGVVGVHYSKEGFYVATWRDNQLNAFTKAVSIRKYGKELAFALACYYRNFMVSDLSITDRHKGLIRYRTLFLITLIIRSLIWLIVTFHTQTRVDTCM